MIRPCTGEVTQLIRSNDHRVVRVNIRFRNSTNEPLILAYVAGSSKIVDNLGTVYYWGPASAHDTTVHRRGDSVNPFQRPSCGSGEYQVSKFDKRTLDPGLCRGFF